MNKYIKLYNYDGEELNTYIDDSQDYELLESYFEIPDDQWMFMYSLANKYYETYGDLKIKSEFKTKDGVNYDEDGYPLGTWIVCHRAYYKNKDLSNTKIELLKKIGMIFDYFEYAWDFMYDLASKYYKAHGDLKIRQDFKTKDGINYDENGYLLGIWIINQRNSYKNQTMSNTRIELLNKIGMVFDYYEELWDFMYGLASNYYETYGDLKIRQDFKTKDGINYDENGYKLGVWVAYQRQAYRSRFISKQAQKRIVTPLPDEKLDKLNRIGMEFNSNYPKILKKEK